MVPLLVVLVVIAVVLLILRPPLREHLSPTLTIKAPPYDVGEKDRIRDMVPGVFGEYAKLFYDLEPARYDGGYDFSRKNNDTRNAAITNDLANQVATAYSEIYQPATQPLTTSSFDTLSTLNTPLTPPMGLLGDLARDQYGWASTPSPLPVPSVDKIKPLRLKVLRAYFEATASAVDPTRTLKAPGQLSATEWTDLVRRIEFAAPDIYSVLGLPSGAYRNQKDTALRNKLQDIYDNLYVATTGPLTESAITEYVNGLPNMTAGQKASWATAATVYLLYTGTTTASTPTGPTGPTGPTSDIKAPNPYVISGESPYSAVETNRISTLISDAIPTLRAAYARQAATGITEEDAKTQLAIFIGRVYTNVYQTSTPPISEAQIKAYVDRSAASFLTDAERKMLVRLGVAYFGATPTPVTAQTAATGPTGGTGTTTTTTATATTRTWRTDGSGIIIPTRLASISTTYESPYSADETNRILNLSARAKAAVEAGYRDVTPPNGVTKEQLVARFLATQVAKFYENFYASLAGPLTLDAIGVYVERTYTSSSEANKAAYKELLQRYYFRSGQVSRNDATFTELDSNTDDMLSRTEFNQYIANQATGGTGGTGAAGGAGGGAGTVSSEFDRAIMGFRTALVNYKLTGNPGFKTQSDSWKQWIEQYIQSAKNAVTENSSTIQSFLQQYGTSDQDLRSLQSGLRDIRQKGPEVQAQYETEKEAQKQEPLDFTQFYSKAGTLAGLLAVIAGVAFFV